MSPQPSIDLRKGLTEAYKATHDHLRYLLTDLTTEQADTEPTPGSRTITYYLHHLVNSELYWLSATGREVTIYPKKVSLEIIIELFDEVRDRILNELKTCSEDELGFQPPTDAKKPSLGWIISRVVLHGLYHSAEIIYTRYAVGGSDLPEEKVEESWAGMINSVAKLIFFSKQ